MADNRYWPRLSTFLSKDVNFIRARISEADAAQNDYTETTYEEKGVVMYELHVWEK